MRNGSVHSVSLETSCPLSRTGFWEWQLNLNENRSPFTPLLWWRGGGTVRCALWLAYAAHSAFLSGKGQLCLWSLCLTLQTQTLFWGSHTHLQYTLSRGSSLHGNLVAWVLYLLYCKSNLFDKTSETLPGSMYRCTGFIFCFARQFWFLSLIHEDLIKLCLLSISSLIWRFHVVFFICKAWSLNAMWCHI